jgi:peptidoglycan hydrolase-like protein with peptidoglycan-binding domain
MLKALGYNLGICGADGDFGTMTLDAVLRFQREHGLKADGIVGPDTYAALDKAAAGKKTETPAEKTYSVIIRGLDYTQASAVANNYPGAEIVEGSVAK